MPVNKATSKRWRDKRVARNKIKYKALCESSTCAVCSRTPPLRIEWHHLDPSQKEDYVSTMVGGQRGWATILKEINKTVPMCYKCHRLIEALKLIDDPSLVDKAWHFLSLCP